MAPNPIRIKKTSNIGKMNRINTISKIPNINPAIAIPLESSTIKPTMPKTIAAAGK